MATIRTGIRWTSAAAGVAVLAMILTACGSGSTGRAATGTKQCVAHRPHEIADGMTTPDVRWAKHGVLETTLRASYGPVTLNGRQYKTMNYEGSVPGPTLVVCPGDTLIVHMKNDLGDAPASSLAGLPTMPDMDAGHGQLTNLHTHGFHVSPRGHSDNVFTSVAPRDEFTYTYHVPEDHPPGMYWYHPHRHGYVDTQVYAGMFGVLYVQGGLDDIPRIADIPTRTIVINALQLGDGVVVADNDVTSTQTLINGVVMPQIIVHPGELQRWRIVNVGPDAMVKLGLEGQSFTVLANDGNTLHRPSRQRDLLIGPGEREEVLVRGGPAGDTQLQSLVFNQFQGVTTQVTGLATVRSTAQGAGKASKPLANGPLTGPQEDLRKAKVNDRHRIVYTEQPTASGGTNFLFNGKIFDPNRLDQVMHLGKVSEWTLVNKTTEWHTFHIHLNKFQVTHVKLGNPTGVSPGRVDDIRRGAIERQDTVKLPPGSTITLRTRPTDFTGKFVFHCHMVFHEDNGMMGTVEIRSS